MTLDYLIDRVKVPRKSWLFPLAIVAISAVFMLKFSEVRAQNIPVNSAQNCDANAVMFCGASSVNQLMGKFNNGDGRNSAASIQHIYSFFGVSSSDISSMSSSSVNVESGWVGKNGRVYDNHNMAVATNALTGGRENISGSTREVVDGTVFFVRPPSVSFQDNFLKAFVVRMNNRFAFAIIASCGNAVKATPVAQAKPAPVTTPMTTSTPSQTPQQSSTTINANCSNVASTTGSSNNTISQGGNCNTNTSVQQQQTTVNKTTNINNTSPTPTPTTPVATTTPSSTPTPTPTEQTPPTPVATTTAAPTTLVNTGPGNLVAIFIAVSIISTVGHHLFISRVKAKQQV